MSSDETVSKSAEASGTRSRRPWSTPTLTRVDAVHATGAGGATASDATATPGLVIS